jgi:hypothetical protein
MHLLVWAALVSVETGPAFWYRAGPYHYNDAAVVGDSRIAVGARVGRWSFFGTLGIAGGGILNHPNGLHMLGARTGGGARVQLGRIARLGVNVDIGFLVHESYDEGVVETACQVASLEGTLEIDLLQHRAGALFLAAHGGYGWSIQYADRLATASLGLGARF